MNSPLVGIQYFIFEILGLQIRESFFYCYCNNFRDSVSFHIDLTGSGFLCCDLSCDKILCCGGSWMVKGDLVKAGEFDKIKELTAEARKLADSIRK